MPLEHQADRFRFIRIEIGPDEIQGLLEAHRQNWADPTAIERQAESLIEKDFEPDWAKGFALSVIRWGGGHRFLDRFAQKNSPETIKSALRDGHQRLQADDPAGAVERLRKLQHLGQSFASKMVRFMAPKQAVILDSVIRNSLGYRETAAGYQDFLRDCLTIHQAVAAIHPLLRVCDIEAAIFAKLQGY